MLFSFAVVHEPAKIESTRENFNVCCIPAILTSLFDVQFMGSVTSTYSQVRKLLEQGWLCEAGAAGLAV